MSSYWVQIEETYTYTTRIEAETAEDAKRIAEEELAEDDGPESAFGSPDYSETEVTEAWEVAAEPLT